MKLIIFSCLEIIPETEAKVSASGNAGYVVGIIISLMILAYLVYSLLKPEKF